MQPGEVMENVAIYLWSLPERECPVCAVCAAMTMASVAVPSRQCVAWVLWRTEQRVCLIKAYVSQVSW